ncbi:MAG: hypothetical protein LPK85_00835 [Gammaproteobacteria bacterium]|nr:hypothetical protein [Gammaproteobacteria bacterium]
MNSVTVQTYLNSTAKDYLPALETASAMIEGFERPYGMEFLATVGWLLICEGVAANLSAVRTALRRWPAGERWAQRKNKLLNDNSLQIAIERLVDYPAAKLP